MQKTFVEDLEEKFVPRLMCTQKFVVYLKSRNRCQIKDFPELWRIYELEIHIAQWQTLDISTMLIQWKLSNPTTDFRHPVNPTW